MSETYEALKLAWANDPVYRKIREAFEESMRHEYPEVTEALMDAMIRCRVRIHKQKGATMRQLMLGIILGSALTGTLVGAGFYDSKGQPAAPSGSIQQFDYFRQRQLFIDAGAMRRNQEEQMRQQRLNPCMR